MKKKTDWFRCRRKRVNLAVKCMESYPKVAFLREKASESIGFEKTLNVIEAAIPGLQAVEALAKGIPFKSVTAPLIQIGDLKIAAASHDPLMIRRSDGKDDDIAFSLPLYGVEEYTIGRKSLRLVGGQSAAILNGEARESETSRISNVLISCNLKRLNSTISTMLGGDYPIQEFSYNNKLLHLRQNGVNYGQIFNNVLSSIDLLKDESLMRDLAIDDQIYRLIGKLVIQSQAGAGGGSASLREFDPRISIVCDYIDANLDKPLPISDLETLSGLSTRVLQYSFKARFGCTPSQWIRERRLLRAREILQSKRWGNNILSVALLLGFPSHSAFSKYYKEKFGELPSETIKSLY